jgi:hypothetical protein
MDPKGPLAKAANAAASLCSGPNSLYIMLTHGKMHTHGNLEWWRGSIDLL